MLAGLPVPNAIISQESVQTIFTPALTEQGAKTITEQPLPSPGTQWGTAMALVTKDWPGGRRPKGTAFCG